ncbi:MAG: nucleotidyl transferase AbiEii/AbiGii toxin family protein [Gemmatimonadota bacterium]
MEKPMVVDRQELIRLAAAHGYREATLEKVIRLGDFLDQMRRHPLLTRALLLKGGTALNLCFGPPRRLSVDLDFNYVGSPDRQGMLNERPEIEAAIHRVGESRDYRIQESRDEHGRRKFFLGYRSTSDPS